jgi:hypothetical protein
VVAPVEAAPAPLDETGAKRSKEALQQELALVSATGQQIQSWVEAKALSLQAAIALNRTLQAQAQSLRDELGDQPATAAPPSALQVVDFSIQALPDWGDALQLAPETQNILRDHLFDRRHELLQPEAETPPAPEMPVAVETPAPAAEVAVEASPLPAPEPPPVTEVPAETVPAPEATPVAPPAPPQPRRPLIEWGKLWDKTVEAFVSGAALRGLLYLGAFMIVVSAMVLVVVYWDLFPLALQLSFAAAVPVAFYCTGIVLRVYLKTPVAGGVFIGIGALLVAVDFAAIYQLGGLAGRVDLNLYWLVASLFCMLIYTATAWRLPFPFFGYITMLAFGSAGLALSRLLGLPLDWEIATVTATAVVMVVVGMQLKRAPERWREVALTSQHLPPLLLALGPLLAIILLLFGPDVGNVGQMATFILATIGFGLLARIVPHAIYAHATVWSSVGAIAFAVTAANVAIDWLPATAAVVSPYYFMAGHLLHHRRTFPPGYRTAAHVGGIGLILLALVAGQALLVIHLWAGVLALAMAALALAWCAYFFRQPLLVAAAAGLFIVPFAIGGYRWLVDLDVAQHMAWLMAALAGLALAYMGLALLLRRAEAYGLWLNLWAHALAPLAIAGLVFNNIATLLTWFAGPTLVALGGVILVYLASAIIHDGGRHPALSKIVSWLPTPFCQTAFLWPIGLLLPVFLSVTWIEWDLPWPWLGAALAGLALAYVGLGQLLARRSPWYRLPPHAYSYLLPLAGIAIAATQTRPLLAALLITVGSLVALAVIYRRPLEVALAGLLFLWPFQLALELSPLTPHAYTLAYALLAALGYIPVHLVLDKRAGRRFALPGYIIAYAVSVVAIALAVLDTPAWFSLRLPWVAVATPLVATGMYLFGVYYFRKTFFAWAAVAALAITFGQALPLAGVPYTYDAAAWAGLAILYMLMERLLARRPHHTWLSLFRWPLGIGSAALFILGLLLSLIGLSTSVTDGLPILYLPLIVATGLLTGHALLAAWLYRSRWPLYLEPWLALLAVTLTFAGYGASLFGRPLKPAEYGLVITGLALAQLLAAVGLDPRKVRYSQGLYLGGYALLVGAISWSTPDRVVLLWSLGLGIIVAATSAWLVHIRRHHTFDELLAFFWLRNLDRCDWPETGDFRVMRAIFLYTAAYALPVWLWQLLIQLDVAPGWQGWGLAIVAPAYIAAGLLLRRVRPEYRWPFFTAGYALTAIGMGMAADIELAAICTLALNVVVYAASAYIFRQAFWLYLSNTLMPLLALLILHYNNALTEAWISGVYVGLAWLYLGADRGFQLGGLARYGRPFMVLGHLLVPLALLVTLAGQEMVQLTIFPAGVLLYALLAWTYRQPLFIYPAAWLVAVPYDVLTSLTPLAPEWYGLAWLPLVVGYILLGRFVFHRRPLNFTGLPTFFAALKHPAMPFYLLAYGLSVAIILPARDNAWIMTLTLLALAVTYTASAALFRQRLWLYPGLAATHLALLSYLATLPPGPIQYLSLPYLGMTWLMALVAYGFSRHIPAHAPVAAAEKQGLTGRSPALAYLLRPTWVQPFTVFAVLNLLFSQGVALYAVDTTVYVATGQALLLGLLALLWRDPALPYGALTLFALAVVYRLRGTGLSLTGTLAVIGGLGFGFYLLGMIAERAAASFTALRLWVTPLSRAAIIFASVAVLGILPALPEPTTAGAAPLAFAGALCLTMAVRRRSYRLGYLGVALLLAAWSIVLVAQDISQPQWYAIPAGLYFIGVGFLERRRTHSLFAILIEGLGLAVLLLPTFIQSVDPASGFPYFLLLLVEALLVTWWGAVNHLKVPFFTGLGASVLNVVAQIVILVNVYDVDRWVIIFGVGLLLVAIAVFVERQRTRIISQAHHWGQVLAHWE